MLTLTHTEWREEQSEHHGQTVKTMHRWELGGTMKLIKCIVVTLSQQLFCPITTNMDMTRATKVTPETKKIV